MNTVLSSVPPSPPLAADPQDAGHGHTTVGDCCDIDNAGQLASEALLDSIRNVAGMLQGTI